MPTNLNIYPLNCSDGPNNALADIRPLPTRTAPTYHKARGHQPPGLMFGLASLAASHDPARGLYPYAGWAAERR